MNDRNFFYFSLYDTNFDGSRQVLRIARFQRDLIYLEEDQSGNIPIFWGANPFIFNGVIYKGK